MKVPDACLLVLLMVLAKKVVASGGSVLGILALGFLVLGHVVGVPGQDEDKKAAPVVKDKVQKLGLLSQTKQRTLPKMAQ